MGVQPRQIERSLRGWGLAYRALLPKYTVGRFRAANRAMNTLLKGRWLGLRTRMEEIWIPRADGEQLRLCVITSRAGTRKGATGLLWLHGGGFAIGLPEMNIAYAGRFAGDGGCVIVAPDYRRSTERPYPAALEDAYAALKWLKENANALGARDDQLFVGGNSAGGGLTAALCMYARDKGEINIAYQIPMYPMLDDRMQTPSAQLGDAPIWDTDSNEAAWKLYLGDLYGTDDVPYYAAPARATDLTRLPPCLSLVGTLEPFYDETVKFMDALRAQGVPVDFRVFEGCFHAFDEMCPGTAIGKEAVAFVMERFHDAQTRYFAAQRNKMDEGSEEQ